LRPRVQSGMAVEYDFWSAEFDNAAWAAGRKAFDEAIAAGLPVFFIDNDGLNVLLRADGRKFEIRWLPNPSSEVHYEIVRELTAHAA
jgi:hypothetical protein